MYSIQVSGFKLKAAGPFCFVQKRVMIFTLLLCALSLNIRAQQDASRISVPDWALPGSATHEQVPPPANFHRATKTENVRIGIFEGQSDVGGALVPGSSSFNSASKQYTVASAGYNVWYQRDEFRFVWKKISGDVSLAADIDFPDTAGYGDRKAFVIIRQSLDDDSKEAMVAIHGAGLMHLAWRPDKGKMMTEVRVNERKGQPDLISGKVTRIGIEKKGDRFSLYVGLDGGPVKQVGESIQLHIYAPFYVGIGFCSHLPVTTDTAIFSNVVLENTAGMVH
jgi:hypothetical protein